MNLCDCAAGRAEPRGAKRAQLKNVAVALEIVRSAKQSVKERVRRVAAQITTKQMLLWLRELCVLRGWLFVSCENCVPR